MLRGIAGGACGGARQGDEAAAEREGGGGQWAQAKVLCPNKHNAKYEAMFKGHLLDSETYIGGKVEALESGVFRSDLSTRFKLQPDAYQVLAPCSSAPLPIPPALMETEEALSYGIFRILYPTRIISSTYADCTHQTADIRYHHITINLHAQWQCSTSVPPGGRCTALADLHSSTSTAAPGSVLGNQRTDQQPRTTQGLLDKVDDDLKYAIEVEGGMKAEDITNYSQVGCHNASPTGHAPWTLSSPRVELG